MPAAKKKTPKKISANRRDINRCLDLAKEVLDETNDRIHRERLDEIIDKLGKLDARHYKHEKTKRARAS